MLQKKFRKNEMTVQGFGCGGGCDCGASSCSCTCTEMYGQYADGRQDNSSTKSSYNSLKNSDRNSSGVASANGNR